MLFVLKKEFFCVTIKNNLKCVGLYKEPKWGHLRDLHQALRLCKKALLRGTPTTQPLMEDVEARVFEMPEQKVCVAFLSNHHTKEDKTVTFQGQQYFVPRHSISILPDCKTVVFSTQHVIRFYYLDLDELKLIMTVSNTHTHTKKKKTGELAAQPAHVPLR